MQLGTGTTTTAPIDRRSIAIEHAGTLTLATPDRDGRSHVSAASGLAAWGGAAWVVSDEYGELVRYDRLDRPGALLPGLAPAKKKPDLEALLAVPQADGGALMLAFGSGSKSNGSRDRALVQAVDASGRTAAAPIEASLAPLYRELRRRLAGGIVNVEGLALRDAAAGAELLLFHRGRDQGQANTIFRLDAARAVAALRSGRELDATVVLGHHEVDLGTLGGERLGFADAQVLADGRIAFVASAEGTDAIAGSVVGILDATFTLQALRPLEGPPRKVEGMQLTGDLHAGSLAFTLVTDPDDPARAAELLRVDLGD